ncbi:LOW QUALITY PROTEIN: olfactory receptor 2AT4 [Lathamus discolor]|uniref:LOW QUALITY PROTEIN: olfactory receptor 2AT4 n=1 Tax=Lathamus discolor TaxID=678569 RepID=UPI0032B78192
MESCSSNASTKVFFLVGFPALQGSQPLLFIVFLLFYLLILAGNAVIITVVVVDPTLHKPMYFFLLHLSVLGVLFTTTTIPKMLLLLKMLLMFLANTKTTSFQGCFLQMYSFHSLTVTKALLLMVMAYDRYEAICKPLYYPAKMTSRMSIQLAASAWITALLIPVPVIAQTSQLAYGHTTRLHHCFCDHLAVVQASCLDSNADFQNFLGFSITMTVSIVPLLLVTISYVHIILSVLRINSKAGRMKAFSMCTSHLLVVGTCYSSITVVYVSYRADIPADVHIMSNVVSSISTPLLNPIIHTLRNKEVKSAVKKSIFQKISPLSIKFDLFG